MRKFIPITIAGAALFAALFSCVGESKDGDSIVKPGMSLPSFDVSGPGGSVGSGDYKGKGGVVVLFASYCSSCRTVLPQIEKVWEASEDGTLFTIAAISRQTGEEDPATVADYWNAAGYMMPYYLDPGGSLYYRFAKQWIPRIYVVDKDLNVTWMSVADTKVTAARIVTEIEKATGTTLR